MIKLITLAFAGLLVLSGCGYDGHYRYPCQDPENWENAECNPPLCKVTGSCTIDILGFDPHTGQKVTVETEQDGEE